MNKTFSQKPAETSRSWYIIDAKNQPLGRLATTVAQRIVGKTKVTFTPHVDNGDHVIVINAQQVALTGDKITHKSYRYSGFPGGLHGVMRGKLRATNPARLVHDAVAGMIPKNKLAIARMKRLHVFADAAHNHEAQKPTKVEV